MECSMSREGSGDTAYLAAQQGGGTLGKRSLLAGG